MALTPVMNKRYEQIKDSSHSHERACRNISVGHTCASPSSPLVDALTIDVCDSSLSGHAPKRTPYFPFARSVGGEQYARYFSQSCEDVDCIKCRTYRLGLGLHRAVSTGSCPSLQLLKPGQDVPSPPPYRSCRCAYGVVLRSPLIDYSNTYGRDRDLSSTSAVPSGGSFFRHGADSSKNMTSIPSGVVTSAEGFSATFHEEESFAQHRRRHFRKGSNRWTSFSRDSGNYTSADSGDSVFHKGRGQWTSGGPADSCMSSSIESNASVSGSPHKSSSPPTYHYSDLNLTQQPGYSRRPYSVPGQPHRDTEEPRMSGFSGKSLSSPVLQHSDGEQECGRVSSGSVRQYSDASEQRKLVQMFSRACSSISGKSFSDAEQKSGFSMKGSSPPFRKGLADQRTGLYPRLTSSPPTYLHYYHHHHHNTDPRSSAILGRSSSTPASPRHSGDADKRTLFFSNRSSSAPAHHHHAHPDTSTERTVPRPEPQSASMVSHSTGSEHTGNPPASSPFSEQNQHSSPTTAFRRKSFLAAVDKHLGEEVDGKRRGSFRAATDPSFLAARAEQDGCANEGEGEDEWGRAAGEVMMTSSTVVPGDGKGENKTVTFRLNSDQTRNGDNPPTLCGNDLNAQTCSPHTSRDGVPGQSVSSKDTHAPVNTRDSVILLWKPWKGMIEGGKQDGEEPKRPDMESTAGQRQRLGSEENRVKLKDQGLPVCALTLHDSALTATTTTTVTSSSTSSSLCTVLVQGSPPPSPRGLEEKRVPGSLPSRLAQLRQNNLTKKRELMKTATKMPELSEHGESALPSTTGVDQVSWGIPGIAISGTEESEKAREKGEKEEGKCREGVEGEERGQSMFPDTEDVVTPSMPDSFLETLGLLVSPDGGTGAQISGETGGDQIPDDKLESRFNSLCLAFKTDRLTLDKRQGIQENSRDLAEQNVEKELQGLREALQLLKQLCVEERAQEVLVKMGHHVDVLEHSIARVSTRAEILGAVQQEKRMCLAMEVMTSYTERLRRLRDKELTQVETVRKMLSEKRVISGHSFDSLCQTGAISSKAFRRRSDVALPRILGGGGLTSLQFSSGMEPKQRFQTATANISVRNLVANTLRHGSLERQKRLSYHSSSASSSSADISEEKSQDIQENEIKQQSSSAEGAFKDRLDPSAHIMQRGKPSADRGDSNQQTDVGAMFLQGGEPADTPQHRDSQPSLDQEFPSTSSLPASCAQQNKLQSWLLNPSWIPSHVTWRHVTAGVIFVFAMAVLIVTFTSSSNMTSR